MADNKRNFIIEFITRLTGRGAEELEQDLEQVEKAAKGAEKELQQVDRAADKLGRSQGLGQSGKQFLEDTDRARETMGKLAALIGTVTAAVSGLFAAIKRGEGIALFDERRNRELFRAGQLTDAMVDKVEALAARLQVATGTADEFWQSLFTDLLLDGTGPESLDGLAVLLEELNDYFGNSEEAAAALTAALDGNFEAFDSVAIKIDETASVADNLRAIYAGVVEENERVINSNKEVGQSLDSLKTQLGEVADQAAVLFDDTFGDLVAQSLNNMKVQLLLTRGILGATTNALFGTADAAEATGRSVEELAARQKEFNTALEGLPDDKVDGLADDAARAARELRQVADGIREVADANNGIDDAKLRLMLATIEGAVGRGDISKESGDVLKAQARAQAEVRAAKRAEAVAAAEVNDLREQRDELNRQLGQAELSGTAEDQDRLNLELETVRGQLALARQRLQESRIEGAAVIQENRNAVGSAGRAARAATGEQLSAAARAAEQRRLDAIAARERREAEAAARAYAGTEERGFRTANRRRGAAGAAAEREAAEAAAAQARADALRRGEEEALKRIADQVGPAADRATAGNLDKAAAAIERAVQNILASVQQNTAETAARLERLERQVSNNRTD